MVSAYRFLDAARSSTATGRSDLVDAPPGTRRGACSRPRSARCGRSSPACCRPGSRSSGVGHALGSWLARLTAGTRVVSHVVGEPSPAGGLGRAGALRDGGRGREQRLPARVARPRSASSWREARASRDHRSRRWAAGSIPRHSPSAAAARASGLLGMRRQASWLGGQATVRSRVGGGTVVRISVPLERHRAGSGGVAGAPAARPATPRWHGRRPAPAPGRAPRRGGLRWRSGSGSS